MSVAPRRRPARHLAPWLVASVFTLLLSGGDTLAVASAADAPARDVERRAVGRSGMVHVIRGAEVWEGDAAHKLIGPVEVA